MPLLVINIGSIQPRQPVGRRSKLLVIGSDFEPAQKVYEPLTYVLAD